MTFVFLLVIDSKNSHETAQENSVSVSMTNGGSVFDGKMETPTMWKSRIIIRRQ